MLRNILQRTYATASQLPPNSALSRSILPVKPKRKRNTKNPLVRIVDGYKTFKPITPGIRHVKMVVNPHLWNGKPVRELTKPLRKSGGRNNTGRITVRSRGGGHKRRLRDVDFHRLQGGPHDVVRIEYDPNRSAHIALVKNRDKKSEQPWSYILACEGLRAGDVVTSYRHGIPEGLVEGYDDQVAKKATGSKEAQASLESDMGKLVEVQTSSVTQALLQMTGASPTAAQTSSTTSPASLAQLSLGLLRTLTIRPGNVLPLRLIPNGTSIHNISLTPTGPAKLVRSAGTWAALLAQDEDGIYTHVRLQSGEVRKILRECCATIGKVSNAQWQGRMLGKAGRSRWLGRRPHVRGMAMNACDHPHGGGRGKSKGNQHPQSPWGWKTKGLRTRKPGPKGHKTGNKLVIKERPRGKAVLQKIPQKRRQDAQGATL